MSFPELKLIIPLRSTIKPKNAPLSHSVGEAGTLWVRVRAIPRLACLVLAAVLACAWPFSEARASDQNTANTQTAYQPAVAVPSRLQVTGTTDKFSLDVERSDVQSTLKAILKQAGKDYTADATVTGQVTLLLTDRPLDVVLHAICEQCYLRYTLVNGIYKFTRDDDAIKKAFTHLKELNASLRQQLRALGLEVPDDNLLVESRREQELAGGAASAAGAPAKSQFQAKRDRQADAGSQESIARRSAQLNINGALGSVGNRADNAANSIKKEAPLKIDSIHMNYLPPGEQNQLSGQNSRMAGTSEYNLFMRQNGFVWFNIPEEKPEAVATVLQRFSQQSNIPILLDQTIPNSLKFRVWGTLSPRQLPEALNLLAPTAHLQWRWIGSMIFVFPAPDFQVSFSDQPVSRFLQRGSYPTPRSESNPSADTKDKKGGSD